jgi:hypothetical protein
MLPGSGSLTRILHKGHLYRLALCGHKAAEIGTACLLLMVQGQLAEVTAAHFVIASKTGLLAIFPALGITSTRYARLLLNRWTSSALLAVCGFSADLLIHASHYPGAYTEAALTAAGGFALSLLVSYTPVGKRLDTLAEHLLLLDARGAGFAVQE